eukprot:7610251-Alexandrium_andersonii.AAC.1
MQGPEMEQDLPSTQRAQGRAPSVPNCFTDGGLGDPRATDVAVGGVGVWLPSATYMREMDVHEGVCSEDPPQMAESMHDFYHDRREGQSLAMWSCVTGVRPSTARVEAVAVLLALFCKQPLLIASGNATVVRVMSRVLSGQHDEQRFPWGLAPNGDVWSAIQKAVSERGASSVAIKKTKGHAQDVHIGAGLSTPWERKGNDHADTLATLGIMSAERDRLCPLWIKAKVAKAYGVAHRIQLMQLHILKEVVRMAEDPMIKKRRGHIVCVGGEGLAVA